MRVRKRQVAIVGVAVAIAAVTTLVLVLVPIPHQFTMNGAAILNPEVLCTGIYAAQGTTVSFQWSSPVTVPFLVLSCSDGQVAYHANGTSGSGSFVSTGSVYQFGAVCTPLPNIAQPNSPCVGANVTGNYSSPLAVATNEYWTPVSVVPLACGWVALAIFAQWFLRRLP